MSNTGSLVSLPVSRGSCPLPLGATWNPMTDRTYRFAFAVEYEVGHVTFAKTLQSAVEEAEDVVADWHLLRSVPPAGWQRRLLGPRNYTLQMGARVRTSLEPRRRVTDAVLIH